MKWSPTQTLHEKSSRNDLLSLRHQPEEKQVPARFTGPEGPTLLVPFRKGFYPDYMFQQHNYLDELDAVACEISCSRIYLKSFFGYLSSSDPLRKICLCLSTVSSWLIWSLVTNDKPISFISSAIMMNLSTWTSKAIFRCLIKVRRWRPIIGRQPSVDIGCLQEKNWRRFGKSFVKAIKLLIPSSLYRTRDYSISISVSVSESQICLSRRRLGWLQAELIKLGKRMSTRQQALATAQVYIKRFYTKNEIRHTNPYLVLTTAFYLACKMEECPQHIRFVVGEARSLWPGIESDMRFA